MDMLKDQNLGRDNEPKPIRDASHSQPAQHSDLHSGLESGNNTASDQSSSSRNVLLKKIAIPIGIVLLGVGVVGLINLLEQPAEKKIEPVTALRVETLKVESSDITFTVNSQGTVSPRTETALISEVSGVVESVSPKLQAGGFFKQGETLLSIDASDYQATVKQAEANLLSKKAKLTQETAQSQQAEREWAITGKDKKEAPVLALRKPFLEEARAAVLYAEAELDQARKKLDRTKIKAPYDGLVKSKNIGVGQYVTVGTLLAGLFAVDYAEVRLALPNDDLAFLQLPSAREFGNQLTSSKSDFNTTLYTTIGGKSYQWPANIVRTEGVIDSRSRVHYAVAQIADPYGLLNSSTEPEHSAPKEKPALSIGSFVKAKIQGITKNNVFVVPRDAFRDENTLMIVDSENRLRLRTTEVIRSDNDFVYITSGINPGDEVIVTGMLAPVDGMQISKISPPQ